MLKRKYFIDTILPVNDPHFDDWIPSIYKRLILPDSMERGDFEFATTNFPLPNVI